jgi:probable rRNA maturation factor
MRVEVSNRQEALECPAAEIRRLVECTLTQEGRDAELSVAVVGEEEMAALNRRFLGRQGATDVLAFPYGGGEAALSGEVVVNAEMALREAAGRAHGPVDELMLYVAHGVLHLLGYDDHEPGRRRRMRERERQALEAVGRAAEF